MFFQDYAQHKEAQIRRSLFWEFEFEKINWMEMRDIVVQRVIERGRMDDYYAILNLYGIEGVVDAIKNIPYMNSKDQAFVCSVFNIDKKDLKCFSRKQSTSRHWNS